MSELIKQMLDNLVDGNQAEAQENFNDAISVKISDMLDARKIQVAQQLGADNGNIQTD
jgi:hypothetical protein